MQRSWLGLTDEDVLEPELEICDPHHHLWSEPVGHYPRYELADLDHDTSSGHNVVETVFVDCASNYRSSGPEAMRPVGETEFVAAQAAISERRPGARIAAIVGHANLCLGDAVEDVLAAHIEAGGGRFRGIRHSGAYDASPDVPRSLTAPPEHLYRQADFRQGLAVLAGMGLSFDAWQYHPQLDEVAELAVALPELSIIVNHLGAPLGVGAYAGRRAEVAEVWKPALRRLAQHPNVVLKVGGIGMARFGAGFERWDAPPTSDQLLAHWGDDLRFCIETFGPSRSMFESNFPVDAESCSYRVLWNAFKKVSRQYSEAERAELFRGTARRVYRISSEAGRAG